MSIKYAIPGHNYGVNQGTRRQTAIADCSVGGIADATENVSAINDILSALRRYGLVATA